MTEFKNALDSAGITAYRFSQITHTPPNTVYQWVRGERRTPGIAWFALGEILKQELEKNK